MLSGVHEDWKRVAQAFSDADLQACPPTSQVMGFFSDRAVIENLNGRSVGKRIATIGYKVLCEWAVLHYQSLEKPTMELGEDHILWKFKSLQLRKGIFPTWLVSPQWYRIDYAAKLYFTGTGEDTKISRLVTVQNDWTPAGPPHS